MIVDLELRVPDAIIEPPSEAGGHLLAIVSESLSNVARHSRASRANVALIADGNRDVPALELTIEDNGIGFDPDGVVKLGHQGLANTRERAASIGATVTIDSRPGAGTRVIVRLPNGTA
jgi:signal transduction histidine kinase